MAMTLEQQRAIAMAQAAQAAEQDRVQGYIAAGKARAASGDMSGMPAADPNTGQPVGVPAFSPNQYGRPGSAAMGAADTTTMGWGDELASYLGSALTGLPRDQVLQEMRGNQSAAQSQNPGSYLAGQVGGGFAQAAMGAPSLGANAARAGAGLGRVALNSALDGAAYGGVYGAGSANGGLADRLAGGLTGAGTGLAVGGAAPYIASGIGQAVSKLISPFASSPEREAAVNLLAQEGVPVTAGQRTGSNALRYAESELGGSKATSLMNQQNAAFTNAAMQKAGGSGLATADNMAALQGTLGQAFNDISNRNTLVADTQLGQDIGKTLNRYGQLLEPQQKPIINDMVDGIIQRVRANGGTLPGPEYQTIRSDLSMAANSTGNQTLATAFRGLRDSLDSAMGRSIGANNPADTGAWETLRNQYGNMKVLQKASVGAGEDAGMGMISPARLRMAASNGNTAGFSTGASDFTDLAKAGQAVMTPLPNSGTAFRSAVRNLGIPAGSATVGNMIAGIPGAIAGATAPYIAGRTLLSGPVQRYLGNQVAAQGISPGANALLTALMRQASTPALTDASKAVLGFR